LHISFSDIPCALHMSRAVAESQTLVGLKTLNGNSLSSIMQAALFLAVHAGEPLSVFFVRYAERARELPLFLVQLHGPALGASCSPRRRVAMHRRADGRTRLLSRWRCGPRWYATRRYGIGLSVEPEMPFDSSEKTRMIPIYQPFTVSFCYRQLKLGLPNRIVGIARIGSNPCLHMSRSYLLLCLRLWPLLLRHGLACKLFGAFDLGNPRSQCGLVGGTGLN
jgi:hypothetical protein